jgi:hypothetical protein
LVERAADADAEVGGNAHKRNLKRFGTKGAIERAVFVRIGFED